MIVDPDFPDHWKTRMLVGLLGGDEAAPVYVLRLWGHCQNRRQSRFENLPSEALKALCRFPGHANKLESSLATSGFVRREGDVLSVCGWDDYNSALVASWTNGAKGGRPKKPKGESGKPTGKPTGSREEKSREEKSREELPPLPPELDTPEFKDAWRRYEDYRRESRAKKLRRASVEAKWREMAAWGVKASIEAIDRTIANGWTGIFPPKAEEPKSGGKASESVEERLKRLRRERDEAQARKEAERDTG